MEPLTLGGSSNYMGHPEYRGERKGGGGRGSKGRGGGREHDEILTRRQQR